MDISGGQCIYYLAQHMSVILVSALHRADNPARRWLPKIRNLHGIGFGLIDDKRSIICRIDPNSGQC